jgi:hypothetical protein
MNMTMPRSRRGITLTEILISIMIMAIGLVSLATLFPVGLERLRQGQRNSRSALLRPAAAADIDAKLLLSKPTFDAMPWYGYFPHRAGDGIGYDPWLQDLPLPSGAVQNGYLVADGGAYRGKGVTYRIGGADVTEPPKLGEGLPVCYDPLWWAIVNQPPQIEITPPTDNATLRLETRFARSPSAAFAAPSTNDGGTASAHGLPRLTNAWPINASVVYQTFVSPDDMVLQEEGEIASQPFTNAANETHTPWVRGSPILPMIDIVTDSGTGAIKRVDQTFDYSFSWLFTGRRVSGLDDTNFIGDIVVFHNRPFALDETPAGPVPAGERVVEAIFGYGGTPRVQKLNGGYVTSQPSMGYSPNTRTVLLRWNAATPDPDVRVGGWIADVTYERVSEREDRFTSVLLAAVPEAAEFYPAQRCHWYRIVRKGAIEDETDAAGNPLVAPPVTRDYRRMVVTIESPVKSKTLIWGTGANAGSPVFTNVALVSPYVVNVFPVSFRME